MKQKSVAVICYPLGPLEELVSSENFQITSFYEKVRSGARLPETNFWDTVRSRVDAALFPYYEGRIIFAALSLNGDGLTSYAPYALVLKPKHMRHVATVFEENSVLFCKRNKIALVAAFPPGHRASWDERHLLAMAKLHTRIKKSITVAGYDTVLMRSGQSRGTDDFIEVHIYGPVHSSLVKELVIPTPRLPEDQVIAERLRRKAAKLKILVRTVP